MRVVKRYNQHRRDLDCDLECENCGYKLLIKGAYDDENYWNNVIPGLRCSKCKKSSNQLGTKNIDVSTRYPEGFQV